MAQNNDDFSKRVLDRVLTEALSTTTRPTLRQLYDKKLEEYGISSRMAARQVMGIEHAALEGILSGTAKFPDALKMLKLASFLGIDAQEIMSLFIQNASQEEVAKLDAARRASFIVKEFDLKQLKKGGLLDDINDFSKIEKRICSFLGLSRIEEYRDELTYALYSSTRKAPSNKMLDFWTKAAFQYFVEIANPNDYDRGALKELIPKIRPYTRDVENGLFTVARALFNVGVTVIYQPLLPNTNVRGATFRVNGKPCIALSGFRLSYSTVWFALMHELHHVLFDMENITSYHITGEPDLLLMNEEQANDFATEYLFSSERMSYIRPFINDRAIVSRYAEEAQVHPSIIYGFFKYQMSQGGNNYWGAFTKYEPNANLMLSKLNECNWEAESIKNTADQIKKALDVTQR